MLPRCTIQWDGLESFVNPFSISGKTKPPCGMIPLNTWVVLLFYHTMTNILPVDFNKHLSLEPNESPKAVCSIQNKTKMKYLFNKIQQQCLDTFKSIYSFI